MGIHGSVLYHNMFRNTDTERGKVPQSLDTSGNDLLGYLLCLIYGYRDNTDRCSELFLLGWKIIQMKNRYTIHDRPGQFFSDIKPGNDLQSILI